MDPEIPDSNPHTERLDLLDEKVADLEKHLKEALVVTMRLSKIVEALVVVVVESGILEKSSVEPDALIALPPGVSSQLPR